jgi:diguanylate cyclase (GGDEF)-like protein
MMPGTSIEDAAKLADQIRAKVQEHAFMYEGTRISVTSSLGVTELLSEMENATDLIKAADKVLYESKQGGRNRVTIQVR